MFRIVGCLPHTGVAWIADRQASDNAQGTRPRDWGVGRAAISGYGDLSHEYGVAVESSGVCE
jgi:hypothetical protein